MGQASVFNQSNLAGRKGSPYILTRLATIETRVIHSRACVLGPVNVNKGQLGSTLTLYNNSAGSGDVVAVIDASFVSSKKYNISCPNGLTAEMGGLLAADITISSDGPEV